MSVRVFVSWFLYFFAPFYGYINACFVFFQNSLTHRLIDPFSGQDYSVIHILHQISMIGHRYSYSFNHHHHHLHHRSHLVGLHLLVQTHFVLIIFVNTTFIRELCTEYEEKLNTIEVEKRESDREWMRFRPG